MEDNIIWTCTYCHINPLAKSSGKCPRCKRQLTAWETSKNPLERQPEWPQYLNNTEVTSDKDESCMDYTKFYDKNRVS